MAASFDLMASADPDGGKERRERFGLLEDIGTGTAEFWRTGMEPGMNWDVNSKDNWIPLIGEIF